MYRVVWLKKDGREDSDTVTAAILPLTLFFIKISGGTVISITDITRNN